MNNGWQVQEDKNIVGFRLNNNHILYIIRRSDGIKLKVIEEDDASGKTRIMFAKFISDGQLGHYHKKKI